MLKNIFHILVLCSFALITGVSIAFCLVNIQEHHWGKVILGLAVILLYTLGMLNEALKLKFD